MEIVFDYAIYLNIGRTNNNRCCSTVAKRPSMSFDCMEMDKPQYSTFALNSNLHMAGMELVDHNVAVPCEHVHDVQQCLSSVERKSFHHQISDTVNAIATRLIIYLK